MPWLWTKYAGALAAETKRAAQLLVVAAAQPVLQGIAV